jgi:hypothetical protein
MPTVSLLERVPSQRNSPVEDGDEHCRHAGQGVGSLRDALTAAGILARGRPIEFVHPTVRRAVYESLPAGQRHRAHRQAAVILDREGAPADRLAAHLVVAERMGDDWVVETRRPTRGRPPIRRVSATAPVLSHGTYA